MAYSNYFTTGYQPYPTLPNITQPAQPSNQINWVQGIEGAKAFPVAPGGSVLLMDSENQLFFIKTADQSGMPRLSVYEYREHQDAGAPEHAPYVTKEELAQALADLENRLKEGTDEQ